MDVPNFGPGLLPSVVYQMPVLPRGPASFSFPLSVSVTSSDPEKDFDSGEIVGEVDFLLEGFLEKVFPIITG